MAGPVRRVRTETAKLSLKAGAVVESSRIILEMTSYDVRGNRIDNTYYMLEGARNSLTGKEAYKYDEQGNIIEMILRDDDGAILSKEVYTYEFDPVGNWTKMTTSVVVIEGGKPTFEPIDVTYRTIAYYLTDAVAKAMQPTVPPTADTGAPLVSKVATETKATGPHVETSSDTAAAAGPNPIKKNESQSPLAGATLNPVNLSTGAGGAIGMSGADGDKVATHSRETNADESSVARPSPKPPVKPVSGGILNGRALRLPTPVYPEFAKIARVTGKVTVDVLIDVTGKVSSARAVNGPQLLRPAAEQAARRAVFSPTLISGQPLKVSGTIHYNFTLAP